MRIAGHGLSIEVPAGWEARIARRGEAGPVLHAASFALRASDGDFGAAATGRMRAGDSFVAVLEYLTDERLRPGRGLFAAARPAAPGQADFGPRQLQVTRRGQLGWQRFFTESGRPLCVYAVIQPTAGAAATLVSGVGAVLATLVVARPGGAEGSSPSG